MTWQIGLSSGACVDAPIQQMLPALQQSGAAGIEVGTPPRHFNPLEEEQIVALGRELTITRLAAISIHAPFGGALDLADPNPHHRHAAIGGVLTAADAIKRLGGQLVIVHPSDLQRHTHDVRARLHDCLESLRIVGENCRRVGVTVVVELPLPHLVGGHPDDFAWLVERLDPDARVCLDTGHAALGRHWKALLDIAGSRLVHVHANDNHGHRDDHLPPGDGAIDWSEIRESLDAIGFAGWVMLELRCPGEDRGSYFRRAFEQALRLLGNAPSAAAAVP